MDNLDQVTNKGGTSQPDLPNATASLVLGVLSISMCYCWGPIGLILAIIGLSTGNKATSIYNANPGVYAEASYKNATSGKICSIIGLILSALTLLWTIFTWSSTFHVIRNMMDGNFNSFL